MIGMVVVGPALREDATLLAITEHGRGKRSDVDDYRLQTRGGQGVINFRLGEQTGRVVAIKTVQPGEDLMVITRNGVVNRQGIDAIRVIGRATQGVRVVALDDGDVVMDIAVVEPEPDDEELDESLDGAVTSELAEPDEMVTEADSDG
jgi:DNA gyrase subunit A